jgi:hypothetical protein
MELFTATGKLNKLFWQLEMFDVCTTGDTAHIDTVFKFLPHTRQRLKACIIAAVKNIDAPILTGVWQKLKIKVVLRRPNSLHLY